MPRVSPTLEGFRAAFRRPSLTLAEIAWRWTVGGLACALFLFWVVQYLDTLPVTNGDVTLLSTRQPFLVGRAITHILRGSMSRAVLAGLLAMIALSLLWIIAASIARAATVRALLDYFRNDAVGNAAGGTGNTNEPRPVRSLIGLNFLRAALMLAAILAFAGAAVLVSFASPDKKPQPALAFILSVPLAALICITWSSLNWLLSLAAIFAVRDGKDSLGALSAAVAFFRERSGPLFAVSTWTGLAHLTAFSIAGTAVSLPLALIRVAPSRIVIIAIILITLAYFAVVDWLYMVRLAGYICIVEMPEALPASALLPAPPPQTSIDRDEPILSDLPNLAPQM
jgi:hypothetical protein